MMKPLKAWFEDSQGQQYEIPLDATGPILVGRGASYVAAGRAFVEFPEFAETKTVSRGHALLHWSEAAGWQMSDNKSRAGLTVDGRKAEGEELLPLREGSVARLGSFQLTFRMRTSEPQATCLFDGPMEGMPELPLETGTILSLTPLENVPIAPPPKPVEPPPPPQPAAPQAAAPPPEDEGGATRPIFDFTPAEISSFQFTPETRFFLDAWVEGKLLAIEIIQGPGRTQWNVGRVSGKPEDTAGIGNLDIPNTSFFRTISRQHALLTRRGDGGWIVKNLSKQGSRVNDQKLDGKSETPIEPGDRLIIGNVVFYFRSGEKLPAYTEGDFDPNAGTRILLQADNLDPEITRELPPRASLETTEADITQAWGYLVENIHLNPRRFALYKRTTRIGSHPLSSDIQMDDPGIGDLYAIVQWYGDRVKIQSKSIETPVRVDHVPYRTSPPLKNGAILRLGNREFHLQIVGEPPSSLATQLHQRLRRALLFFVISLNILFFGSFLGFRMIIPDKQSVKKKDLLSWETIVGDVVKNAGAAGLGALENSLDRANERLLKQNELLAENKLATEQEKKATKDEEDTVAQIRDTVIKQMKEIIQAANLIGNASPELFQQQAPAIQKILAGGGGLFRAAYLDDSLAKEGWFADIVKAFDGRKDEAFSSQWVRFLQALGANQLEQATNELSRLSQSGFRKDRVDDANEIISTWKKIQSRTRELDANRIVDDYKRTCREGKGRGSLMEAKGRLDQCTALLESISGSGSDAAKTLALSGEFKQADATVKSLDRLVALMESYNDGDERFASLFPPVSKEVTHIYLTVMRNNFDAWQAWNDKYKKAGSPLDNSALNGELQRLKSAVSETVDPDSPFIKGIQTRISGISGGRLSRAESLRNEAESQSDIYTKLSRLLDAVELDPQEKTLTQLESLAVRHLGELNQGGKAQILGEKEQLTQLYQRYSALIRKGVLPDSYPPKLQIGTLMRMYGFGNPK